MKCEERLEERLSIILVPRHNHYGKLVQWGPMTTTLTQTSKKVLDEHNFLSIKGKL